MQSGGLGGGGGGGGEKFELWKGYLCDKWKGPSWYGVNSG